MLKDFGNEDLHVTSNLADKEFESSAPLSWVTSSSSEEDAGSGEPFPLSLFPEYLQFNFPRQTVLRLEDGYSSLWTASPRKQIPIGPTYQADIPPWDPNTINDGNEQMVGTCVISPSPSEDNVAVGKGRRECDCLDDGSARCVRQHIKEVRYKLREVIGGENFSDLGFYEMGEDVACKWTEEEEGIFHEVIYSNPASLGKNFWTQLSVVFPSRTMKDLVSYYFNVFILRRRAVQNRSRSLEIDSDDDEWQGNGGSFFGHVGYDEDSAVESFGDQDVQVGSEDDIPSDDEEDGDDDDDSDDGDGGVEVDGRTHEEDATDKNEMRGQFVKPHIFQLQNDDGSECLLQMLNPSEIREDHNVLEDSSNSCDSQLYTGASCVSFGVGHDTRKSTLKEDVTGCLTGESNDSSDGLDSGLFLEPGDVKVWDASCSTGLARGVDLLPTCNMIEEIFGPYSSKSN